MADEGRMPPPIKLGSLCRWSRVAIDDWIANGCPAARRGWRDERR
jgi:predicted DNA-binding transcriptional regulator AlpA